jgi:hypothetical protein
MAELDAACAWINPGLALVAVAVAVTLLDLAAAAQRWTVARLEAPPAPARIVTVAAEAEACSPDMAGRD